MSALSEKTSAEGHAPTPWRVENSFRRPTPDGGMIAQVGGWPVACVTGYYGEDGANANAALIVQAVNAHEDLVDALERLLAEHEQDAEAHGRPSRYAWDQARAALAKAGEHV